MENKKNLFHKIFDPLRSFFLSGLLMLLPIIITVVIFKFLLNLLRGWLTPLCNLEPVCLRAIPGFELILALAIIIVIGIISRVFIFKKIVHVSEHFIDQVPFVRAVYSGIKQIVHAFTHQDKESFQQVVWVEFPRKNCFSIGFLTGPIRAEYAPNQIKQYFNIFVPNVPNLTAGHYIVVPQEDFRPSQLTRQEAVSIIISGGIVQPVKKEN